MRFDCARMQIDYRMIRAARTFKCGVLEHSVELYKWGKCVSLPCGRHICLRRYT